MSDSLRYKIVLWIVWVQIALLPIIYMMLYVTEQGVIWRWNLVNWLMVGGYLLGLFALPFSRGLEKPKLLKWWLRIDFWLSLIPAVLVLPLLFYAGRHNINGEDNDYVLYQTRGFMMTAPYYRVGKKDGLFIRELPQTLRMYDYSYETLDFFKVDTEKGYLCGLKHGLSPFACVLPIDSARYHQHGSYITSLIDSLYQVQPLLSYESCGSFVYPNDFAEIDYFGKSIMYEDSIRYDVINLVGDSLEVTFINSGIARLSYPKDSVGNLSPKEVRIFVEKLKGDRQ